MSGLQRRGLAVSDLDHLNCAEGILSSVPTWPETGASLDLFRPGASPVLAEEETKDHPTPSSPIALGIHV